MQDYEGYEKSLEAIRSEALHAYWTSFLDINVHQVNVGRTYLWVAAALVGAYVAALDRYEKLITGDYLSVIFGASSFTLAAIAFGLCLWAIPARRGYRAIPSRGWGEFSLEAYSLLKNGEPNLYSQFLTNHISTIDHAFAHNFRTNKDRAKLLRATSWLLIASFAIAIVCGIIVLSKNTVALEPPKENTVSTEDPKSADPKPESEPADSELSVPEPPPPADIDGSDISTHSENPGEGTTFITEDIDNKEN